MFSSSQKKDSQINQLENKLTFDPFTLWLIRLACLMIIIIFSGILLGLPILISFGKSQLNYSLMSIKEVLKTLIDTI
tara:strand:- start:9248 stop:9478 length:231 start_codon:yes stop_codon:yes gene_type:complete